MKKHKRQVFGRMANAIKKNTSGCRKSGCEFSNDDLEVSSECHCLENLRDLSRQLEKELKTV